MYHYNEVLPCHCNYEVCQFFARFKYQQTCKSVIEGLGIGWVVYSNLLTSLAGQSFRRLEQW